MRNRYLAASLTEIESGLRMKPHDPYLLFLRGRAHILMGDIRRGEASLQQALREDSLMLLVAYRDLSNIYFQKKEYQAVASLIQPILEVYSREAFGSILWINPYKEDAKKDIADLWVRFGLAKIGLKDEAGAKDAFQNAIFFSPEEGRASRGLACLKKSHLDFEIFRGCFNVQ